MVVLLVTAFVGQAQAARRQAPNLLTARAAILIDNESGEVIWEHNPDQPLPPASTTKVLTALIALQSGRLDESFPVSSVAAAAPPSKIYLRAGSRVRLDDLVYAILLNSANDASVVIAEGLGGSVPGFARQMNAMARLLGARSSNFINPNGLPDDNHLSTARDLATIFRHAMRNPRFVRAIHTKSSELRATSGNARRVALRSHNRLLDNYHLPVVGKTGWTRAAGKCFVGSASHGEREVSFAILGSTDVWADIKRLLAFGLENGERPMTVPTDLQMAAASSDSTGGGDSVAASDQAPRARQQYSVRLGTFPNYRKASQVRSYVERRGYPARIEKVRKKKGSAYRVAVGQYSNQRAAQNVATDLRRHDRNLPAAVVAHH
jgi:D-alanyl-D-alanine carboxypeptidase (penicillin-binding protein 5/6)